MEVVNNRMWTERNFLALTAQNESFADLRKNSKAEILSDILFTKLNVN